MIFQACQESTEIVSIHVSTIHSLDIGKPGAEAVAKTLVANKTLNTLSLRENGIGSEGAIIIAQGLKTSNSLTSLDLSSNSIGPDGASILSEALLLSNVAHLHLARNSIQHMIRYYLNDIGDTGAHALADLIIGARALVTLDVSANKIGSAGGKYLGKIMLVD